MSSRSVVLLLILVFTTAQRMSAQPFGLSNRVAAAALKMPALLPVQGYLATNALGTMTFTAPLAIVSAPGETNRLFIIEQPGRIIVITNLASPTRTVFMDLTSRVHYGGEEGMLGLALHPGYLTNRYFFVDYTTWTNSSSSSTRQDRLSRFEISPSNPNQGLPNSEVVLISQPDDFPNHNAGDLHFGPDGYLYVSLGDEGDANDTGANSQRIDKDFFSGMLRLDVDKLPGSLAPTPHPASSTNYAIPSDNPFIGATQFNGIPLTGNVRTEFWAVGLRNPWRFSIDHVSGLIYCGDVGQGAREEVDIIVKGGNYGWNYREGYIQRPGSGAPPAGFSSIPPILDYPRTPAGATNVGYSVTGGVVYRGSRIPQLTGAYVFGDYGSGNIWALRYDGSVTTNIPYAKLLADPGVAAFGIDPSNGDVLYADVTEGVVRRLMYGIVSGGALPATLAETGTFTNLTTLTPSPGVIPFDVNVPYWSDNAIQSRWFAITNPAAKITFRPTQNWSFPGSSLWIQHFELELTNGVPESRRRLETRFIVRDSGTGIYGVTYRWDLSQTNASLVGEAGLDETFLMNDGGNLRTQTWHYPSRAECLVCHTSATLGGQALGFNTPQLNRDFNYGGVVDNQIRALNNAGYFAAPVTNINNLRALINSSNETASLEWRARSYLTANCSGCHQGGGSTFDARLFTPLSIARIVNGSLTNNAGGDTNNRVIVPGFLSNSMLLTRISTLDNRRMPPLGSIVPDSAAISLFSRWITNDLPSYRTFADWQISFFGSTNGTDALTTADPDNDGAINQLEWLTGTSPLISAQVWGGPAISRAGDSVRVTYPRVANRGFEVQYVTNLVNSNSWQALDVPKNRPFFGATNLDFVVPDVVTNTPKYYRLRVYEP